MDILKLDKWCSPATSYSENRLGNFRIRRLPYTRGHYQMYGIDGHILFEAKKPLPITHLQELRKGKWHDWMIDDPPHWRAMEIYGSKSHGSVLCGGLGLGLILHALYSNTKVTKITIVEQSLQVIHLLKPHLPVSSRVSLICDDFSRFIQYSRESFDVIIADIWATGQGRTKLDLYLHEAIPLRVVLHSKFPFTKLVFHGFTDISDIHPVWDSNLPPNTDHRKLLELVNLATSEG